VRRCMKSTVACSAVLRLLRGHVSAVLVVGITPTALLWLSCGTHLPCVTGRQHVQQVCHTQGCRCS
jgi:hypothetical protein